MARPKATRRIRGRTGDGLRTAGRPKKGLGAGEKPLAVDEYINLESVDPDFDKVPEFIEHCLGHRIPIGDDE